jgi:hypothetical protein
MVSIYFPLKIFFINVYLSPGHPLSLPNILRGHHGKAKKSTYQLTSIDRGILIVYW